MSKILKYVEVLMDDRNRIVNAEYPDTVTVREALIGSEYKWEPDSVQVNGDPLPDNALDIALEQFVVQESGHFKLVPRVRVTMTAPKPVKPKKAEEVGE